MHRSLEKPSRHAVSPRLDGVEMAQPLDDHREYENEHYSESVHGGARTGPTTEQNLRLVSPEERPVHQRPPVHVRSPRHVPRLRRYNLRHHHHHMLPSLLSLFIVANNIFIKSEHKI